MKSFGISGSLLPQPWIDPGILISAKKLFWHMQSSCYLFTQKKRAMQRLREVWCWVDLKRASWELLENDGALTALCSCESLLRYRMMWCFQKLQFIIYTSAVTTLMGLGPVFIQLLSLEITLHLFCKFIIVKPKPWPLNSSVFQKNPYTKLFQWNAFNCPRIRYKLWLNNL